jgi:hypothetical protein
MQDEPAERAGRKTLPNEPVYETFVLSWKGQALTLRWCVQWFGDVTAHLEIVSQDRRPHPISETGYRSHFCHRELVESVGGPMAFVTAWLETKDDGKAVQLSLF